MPPVPCVGPALLFAVLCLLLFRVAAQQPGYFVLGDEQFRGMQIYDVIQDPQHNYLFATDEGVYRYDLHHFTRMRCAEAKSEAMFNFVADSRGRVFCCNINHQIFRIENGQIALLYELQKDEINPDLALAIGPGDVLLASARKVIAFDAGGRVRTRSSSSYWGQPYRMRDGSVLYHKSLTDSVLRMGADGPHMHALHIPPGNKLRGAFSFFRINALTYAVELQTKTLYSLDEKALAIQKLPDNSIFARSRSLRIYPVGNTTWIAGSLPGAIHLNKALDNEPFNLFYQNYFISDIFKDHEGNILLSTFDHGVLVVPDLAVPDVIGAFQDDPVTALYTDPADGSLYVGSSKGRLMCYADGQLQVLKPKGIRAIEAIYGRAGFPYLIFDDGVVYAWNLRTGKRTILTEAVLKDAIMMDGQMALLGTNLGLLSCTWDARGAPVVKPVPGFNFRIHRMVRIGASQALIVSSSLGLFYTDATGQRTQITFGGRGIFPTALAAHGDTVFAATQQDGIFQIIDRQVVGRFFPQQTQPESLRKLRFKADNMIANSSHALYIFGKKGELLQNISKANGFADRRVYDFAVQDSQVWVSHSGGVQVTRLATTNQRLPVPELRLVQVSANDQPIAIGAGHIFGSSQRKVAFVLTSPSLRYKERIRIHYRLGGYEDAWQTKPNDGNPLIYNALAPGTYTFTARAEHQGVFSEPVTYRFTIEAPYYARWWFWVLSVLLVTGLVAVLFRWQLRIQRRKAQQINELNASRLTAIQSQMNPHFLFNALNSIQALVLKGDVENSYTYLTTFSNLVRSTLMFSDKDFIDFSQEIRLLQLYLSLEQLRFKKDLIFEIETADIEDIQLPPLLIQPFVENALIHGLLHKSGEKRLHIRFELQEALICTIEDNGIGRERARAIRERQRGDHESFSGQAIRKRFDILSDVFRGQFGYEEEDLTENGESVGTRVRLTIPIRRRF